MTILIPAYEPDMKLINLIKSLKSSFQGSIIVVDDGSGPDYKSIFMEAEGLGCKVIGHDKNKGKGCALKTGFAYILKHAISGPVVTADSDGQHVPEDILKVGEQVLGHKGCIVLGSRRFAGRVPLRSRVGNSITRMVFASASGFKVYDTQTGLRGFSEDMIPWLCTVKGERYEYEMNMLLDAASAGYGIYEVPVSTIYLEKNKSSHFNTFRDSIKVYLPIIKYSMSSITSGILDFFLLMVFQPLMPNLFTAVMISRVCSSIFNYTINRLYVFPKGRASVKGNSAVRYFLLVIVVMLLNYMVLYTYNVLLNIPIFFAKLITEATIFIFSFWCQRLFVFKSDLPK